MCGKQPDCEDEMKWTHYMFPKKITTKTNKGYGPFEVGASRPIGCLGRHRNSHAPTEQQFIGARFGREGSRKFRRKLMELHSAVITKAIPLPGLIHSEVVGPADGSAYVIPYFGAGVTIIRSDNETFLLPQADWHNIT